MGNGVMADLAPDVLPLALTRGREAHPLEWLGLLLGTLGEDGLGPYVLIEAIVFDEEAEGKAHAVHSTLSSEANTRARAQKAYPQLVPVGWIHGHVGHGVEFSAADRANQRTWSRPDAIGLVVDPWSVERLALYIGPDAVRAVPVRVPASATEKPSSSHDEKQVPPTTTATDVGVNRMGEAGHALHITVVITPSPCNECVSHRTTESAAPSVLGRRRIHERMELMFFVVLLFVAAVLIAFGAALVRSLGWPTSMEMLSRWALAFFVLALGFVTLPGFLRDYERDFPPMPAVPWWDMLPGLGVLGLLLFGAIVWGRGAEERARQAGLEATHATQWRQRVQPPAPQPAASTAPGPLALTGGFRRRQADDAPSLMDAGLP